MLTPAVKCGIQTLLSIPCNSQPHPFFPPHRLCPPPTLPHFPPLRSPTAGDPWCPSLSLRASQSPAPVPFWRCLQYDHSVGLLYVSPTTPSGRSVLEMLVVDASTSTFKSSFKSLMFSLRFSFFNPLSRLYCRVVTPDRTREISSVISLWIWMASSFWRTHSFYSLSQSVQIL